MTNQASPKAKRRMNGVVEIIIAAFFLIAGVFLDHYAIPYFQPHSHLRVLYVDSGLTIDNVGRAPVAWAEIEVRTNHAESLIKNFTIRGSLDIRKPEPYGGGNYFWLVVSNIAPKDWGAVEIAIDGPTGIQIEVKSSCQQEIGGKQTVALAPAIGAWGEEESYQQWLQKHKG
jgi:hypothetical protein